MSAVVDAGGKAAGYLDDRLGIAKPAKGLLNKVFPDHWSFMLGEIALYSFIVLLLTGTYLTLWYKPSMTEVIYNGSYIPLNGVSMSEAFASTLNISFDVRGGLLMRQIHHWAALFFLVSISVHLMRVFFTGAFRKPRELNWVIGTGLLTLAILEGFAGYSLPDDLLSGTGLRIAQGIVLSIPIIGTWAQFLLFGGQFPGTDFIPRLFTVHVLLLPGIFLALIGAHLLMVFAQKHTQYPGPGRTNNNVVGFPLLPVYMAKAGGFFFIVFGVTALMSAFVTINPIWAFGPYTPDQVSAGSQPDWYMGWLDGAVRIFPNWETNIGAYSISWNVFIPTVVVPGIIFTLLGLYPFIERWVTGDNAEHNLLDRPRNAPTRTAIGVMAITFYGMLWISGGNDIIATTFDLSINAITYSLRVLIFIVPPIAFVITKRICLSLQRRDNDKLLHGIESGNILRTPEGEFIEIHTPLPAKQQAVILSKHDVAPLAIESGYDENGVADPKRLCTPRAKRPKTIREALRMSEGLARSPSKS
jgi:ubiquinol-cytochrome c reductase cytochrome b subunit